MKTVSPFEPFTLGTLTLANRIVMAPMTRTRAEIPMDVPNELNALYYSQRASAGLIISEATHVSQQAIGYQGAPGIFTTSQIEGWRKVTKAVHAKGGKIFMQLFHTGRLSHPYFQRQGEQPVAPSAVQAQGYNAYITNYHQETIQIPFATPRALGLTEINQIIEQFASAAQNAMNAGFDGIEIHAANGYLIDQFLNPKSNLRTDSYGGSIENRSRLLLEITEAVASSIGKEKTAVRLSPFGTLHDMESYQETQVSTLYLAQKLQQIDIVYLHLFNQAAFGTGELPDDLVRKVRNHFSNTLILCGGYTLTSAIEAMNQNLADLIAYGRPFIGNPDLVERFRSGAPLAESDTSRWYGVSGETGYTDYPTLEKTIA